MMKIAWDAKAKAVYIDLPCELEKKIEKRVNVQRTVQVHGYDQIYLDYNKAHELIGIEILNADEPILETIKWPPTMTMGRCKRHLGKGSVR